MAGSVDKKVIGMGAAIALPLIVIAVVLVMVFSTGKSIFDNTTPPGVPASQSGKSSEELAEQRRQLEKRLPADKAWTAIDHYGARKYTNFALSRAGLLWETAIDKKTWSIKAICTYVDKEGKEVSAVCVAEVEAADNGPQVTSFTLE